MPTNRATRRGPFVAAPSWRMSRNPCDTVYANAGQFRAGALAALAWGLVPWQTDRDRNSRHTLFRALDGLLDSG